MSNLRYQLVIDLAGNLQARAQAYGRSLAGFAQTGERQLSRLRSVVGHVDRGMEALGNRYVALAGGAAGAGAVRFIGNLQERMTYLGIQAGKTDEEIAVLKNRIFEIAQMPDIRLDPAQIMDAVDKIVEKTGDLDFAAANLRNIGLAARAANAAGVDIGGLVSEFKKLGIESESAVLRAIDTLVSQGKAGAFTLQNLASQGERATAAYASMGYQGQEAVQAMGALLQMARMGTGSAETATTAYEAMLRTIVSKGKDLQKAGIAVFDPEKLKQGVEEFRPMPEIIKDILRKADGKATLLQPLFGDEGYRAITSALAEYKKSGGFEGAMDQFLRIDGDGSQLTKDAERGANTFNAALQSLTTAAQSFADTNLAGPVQAFADALNALDPETQAKLIDRLGWSIIALGGAVATWKAGKMIGAVGGGIAGMLRGRRGGAGAGGVAGGIGGALAGAAGPMPVVVMNWPGGMMAGAGASAILDSDGRPMRRTGGRAARGWRGAAAGLAARGGSMAGGFLARSGAMAAAYHGSMAVANLAQGDVKGAASEGGAGLGALGGAALGAKGGALIGTMIMPGVGTAIGGAIGAAGGAIIGSEAGRWIADELSSAVSALWSDVRGNNKAEPGEAKVSVDFSNLPAGSRVTSVSSKGAIDVNVDAGMMMVAP